MTPDHAYTFRLGDLYDRLVAALALPDNEAYQSLFDIYQEFGHDDVTWMLTVIREDIGQMRSLEELKGMRPISVEKDPRFERTLNVVDHTGKVIGYIDTKQAQVVADWLKGLER